MKRTLALLLTFTMIMCAFVVVPTTVEAAEDYRAWAQTDSRWSSIRLGSSPYTIGSDGCLVSSITKLIIQAGFRSPDSFNIGTLANWLNSNGGYTSGGLLYWAKPSACISGFNYYGKLLNDGTYNSTSYNGQLVSWVNSGYHITLQVSNGNHWIAIDEAKTKATGEVYIMDSSYDVRADLTLSSRYGTFNSAVAYTGGSSYVDLGTDFYAFIINTSSWKHLTVEQNLNITIRSEKSHYCADQVFKFERQGDGSYKIISTANGYCLDVSNASNASGANVGIYQSNDTDAQRWYISGSSSQYTLKAKCTDCVLDVYSGSSDDGANVQMFDSNGSAAQKFQIYKIENRPFAADLGNDFTAPILNTKSWITLGNDDDNNLSLQKEAGISRQLWRFKRQTDGSYKIYSCYDGKCVDLYWALHDDGTNISLCNENTNNAQRWYLYSVNGSYAIQSKESGKVFDVYNGSQNYGTNIQAWTWNGTDAQLFSIYRGDECKIKAPTLSVANDSDTSNMIFIRNEVYGETGYNLKIWKNTVSEDEAFQIIENADKETTVSLPTGSYQAYVEAYNYYDMKKSNTVSFTVIQDIEPTEPSIIKLGDVDGDGGVSIFDATCIQRNLAEMPTSQFVEAAADADGDGDISIFDATVIQRWLAQLPSNDNIGKPIA